MQVFPIVPPLPYPWYRKHMHTLTEQVITELDMLYGLYQMAVDLVKKIQVGDEEQTDRVLKARKKILDHTAKSSADLITLLKGFQEEKWIPANEKALVEEKRNLLLDLGIKMQASDNQAVRLMQAKLKSVRGELADSTERKNGIKAYIQAPKSLLQVQ